MDCLVNSTVQIWLYLNDCNRYEGFTWNQSWNMVISML